MKGALQQRKSHRWRWRTLVAIQILSSILSTNGFCPGIMDKKLAEARPPLLLLFAANDNVENSFPKTTASSAGQPPPSCVLKKRNPYDVHVYYSNLQEQEAAMELRQQLQSEFDWMRFYPPKDYPIGPHPLPMWEADFGSYDNRHKWTAVRDFLVAHNSHNLSILIHPHSVDGDYADHTQHAFWAGEILELRIRGWNR